MVYWLYLKNEKKNKIKQCPTITLIQKTFKTQIINIIIYTRTISNFKQNLPLCSKINWQKAKQITLKLV